MMLAYCWANVADCRPALTLSARAGLKTLKSDSLDVRSKDGPKTEIILKTITEAERANQDIYDDIKLKITHWHV